MFLVSRPLLSGRPRTRAADTKHCRRRPRQAPSQRGTPPEPRRPYTRWRHAPRLRPPLELEDLFHARWQRLLDLPRATRGHFLIPVAKMQLVEVIHTEITATESMDRVLSLVRTIDHLPPRVLSSPGFLVNRAARGDRRRRRSIGCRRDLRHRLRVVPRQTDANHRPWRTLPSGSGWKTVRRYERRTENATLFRQLELLRN